MEARNVSTSTSTTARASMTVSSAPPSSGPAAKPALKQIAIAAKAFGSWSLATMAGMDRRPAGRNSVFSRVARATIGMLTAKLNGASATAAKRTVCPRSVSTMIFFAG